MNEEEAGAGSLDPALADIIIKASESRLQEALGKSIKAPEAQVTADTIKQAYDWIRNGPIYAPKKTYDIAVALFREHEGTEASICVNWWKSDGWVSDPGPELEVNFSRFRNNSPPAVETLGFDFKIARSARPPVGSYVNLLFGNEVKHTFHIPESYTGDTYSSFRVTYTYEALRRMARDQTIMIREAMRGSNGTVREQEPHQQPGAIPEGRRLRQHPKRRSR